MLIGVTDGYGPARLERDIPPQHNETKKQLAATTATMAEEIQQHPSVSETEVTRDDAPSVEVEDEEGDMPNSSLLSNQDRQLAHDRGYKTVGEFEEYMSQHRALDDSSDVAHSHLGFQTNTSERQGGEDHGNIPDAVKEEADSDRDDPRTMEKQTVIAADLRYEELIKVGGRILMLHDEILHKIFAWLPVDTYAILSRVSPHWKHLTRTEAVYRRLCERVYLNQNKQCQLNVSLFGGSYRSMLEHRPRVWAAGGVYVQK